MQAGRVRLPLHAEQSGRVLFRSMFPASVRSGWLVLARSGWRVLQSRFQSPAQLPPAAAPGPGPAPGPADSGRAGPALVQVEQAGRGRCRSMFPASVRSGDVRRGSILPASVWSCPVPLARLPSPVRLPVWLMQAGRVRLPVQVEQAGRVRRGHFRKQPRFFRPLHRAENFQRFFRRGILCARSKS